MLREIEVTIEKGSRDAGKTFKIKELPAYQMDKWMIRLLGCFAKQDLTITDIVNMSFADLTTSLYKIESEDEKNKLFDELLSNCFYNQNGVDIPLKDAGIDAFVSDWQTLFRLRNEALKLNLGFFENGEESTSN